MADVIGQKEDFQQGGVKRVLVDQGNGNYAEQISIGAPGGVKAWGRTTVTGPVTLRAADARRKSWFAKNIGPSVLFIGGAGTTNADGLEIGVGETVSLNDSIDAIGADVPAAGSAVVHWLEERNA